MLYVYISKLSRNFFPVWWLTADSQQVLKVAELMKEAGFPAGLVNVISGDGRTGDLLARNMRIGKISFTGSVATGKKVAQAAAASNLKNVTLELGGKSPAVIFSDADLDIAVAAYVNSLYHFS